MPTSIWSIDGHYSRDQMDRDARLWTGIGHRCSYRCTHHGCWRGLADPLFPSANRDRGAEHRPAAGGSMGPDLPTMILNDPLAYRQSDAHSVLLGGGEGLEEPVPHLRR